VKPFRSSRLSYLVFCFCLASTLLCGFGSPQSPQASRSAPLAKGDPQRASSPKASSSPAKATPGSPSPQATGSFRFLGWKHARQQGPQYLSHFLRQHAGLTEPAPIGAPQKSSSSAATSRLTSPALSNTPQSLPGFNFRPTLPADFLPTSVATGDFNRDGKMDWVIANGGSNNLWLYLGHGDGTSALPTIIPLAGQSPTAVAAASLRGNGILDLIVAEADSSTIEVFLGNGDGTFGAGTQYSSPQAPTSLAIADFNHDGHADVLVGLTSQSLNSPAALFLGNGSGSLTFSGSILYSTSLPAGVTAITAVDLNGDGYPDFIAMDTAGVLGYHVFLNHQNGTFTESQDIQRDGFLDQPTAFAVGDMDEDGCVDLVTTDSASLGEILKGNCDGTFVNTGTPLLTFGLGDTVGALQLADVNGDGHLDVVASGAILGIAGQGQNAGNLLCIALGDGTGNVSAPKVYRGEPGMYSLSVADFNNDGHPDVVTANQDTDSASVFLNDGSGGFGDPSGRYIGPITNNVPGDFNSAASGLVFPDVNGDNRPDIALVEYDHQNSLGTITSLFYQITTLLNDGTGHFAPAQFSTTGISEDMQFNGFTFADFRNTGRKDFLMVSAGDASAPFISFAASNGDGTFAAPLITHPANAQGIIATGDFNHDGNLDFVTVGGSGATAPSNTLTIFLGHGNGTFTVKQSLNFDSNVDDSPAQVVAGDFNHDGHLDLLVALTNEDTDSVYEFLSNGDGTFAEPKLVLSKLGQVIFADLNDDGLPDVLDLVSTNLPSFEVPPNYAIYLAQTNGAFKGDGSYAPYVNNNVFGLISSFTNSTVADFNGDGSPDIAAFQSTAIDREAILQILLGNGDGTFTPSFTTFRFGSRAFPQNSFDVDRDGRADLIELDTYSTSFNVLKSIPGPIFQLSLNTDPVIGGNGGVTIFLPLVPTSSTTVTLTASDPAISIPSSVTIPAGALSDSVPFTISNTFNRSHVFSITAMSGGQTQVVYGTVAAPGQNLNVTFTMAASSDTVPGGTTNDYTPTFESIGGYASDLTLSCNGLPVGATCQFGAEPLALRAGKFAITSLVVHVDTTVTIGSYPFTVTATDGSITLTQPATLFVGDFRLSVTFGSRTAVANGSVAYQIAVTGLDNFTQAVDLACVGLPAGASCSFTGGADILASSSPTPLAFNVNVPNLPVGTYPFTVIGTAGPVVHSVTEEFLVGDFTGSVSPTALTIDVGQQGTGTVTLKSVNSLTGDVELNCPDIPSSMTCSFNPILVTLPQTGSVTAGIIIQVNSQPAATLLPPQSSSRPRAFFTSAKIPFTVLFALLMIFLVARNPKRRAFAFLGGLVFVAYLAGCGGGGGGGSAPPPPPPPPTVVDVKVVATFGNNDAKTIGTIKVSVPVM